MRPSNEAIKTTPFPRPFIVIMLSCCYDRFRALERVWDVFISVELTKAWRLHLVFGKKDPKVLRTLLTGRLAALSTMLTLLIGSQTAVLFSPSRPAETARTALKKSQYQTVAFWAGLVLCLGIIFSILSLLATLTAWSIIAVMGHENCHTLLKSSLGLHAAALPVRWAHLSIYIFFLWINLFWYVICSLAVAIPLSTVCWLGMFHVISLYAAVGRTVMYSGAITDDERILAKNAEYEMSAPELSQALIHKAIIGREGHIPIHEQYRIKYQEQLKILEEGGSLHFDSLRRDEFKENDDDDDEEKRGGSEEKKQE